MSAANFASSINVILRLEGGYVDNPKDPGGATNMGITRKTLALWRGISPWSNLPKTEVRTLGVGEASAIYKSAYWDRSNCDQLASGLDLAIFDFAVNSGPSRAIRTLQDEIGAKADGIVGPQTLAAIDRVIAGQGVGALIDAVLARRLSFLRRLAIYATFGTGWTNRIGEIRKTARGLAGLSGNINLETRRPKMDILSGYKTYIVGIAMILAAICQLAGIDLPGMSGQSTGQLLMEGLAIVFLRRGITSETKSE